MGSSNDNLSNEEKFIIEFRIRHQWNKRTKTQLLSSFLLQQSSQTDARSDEADPFKAICPDRPMHSTHFHYITGSPKMISDLPSFVDQVSKGLEVKNYELCPYWVR